MKKPSITVHTIVKNEDQWIWYALNSVLPYVQKILVADTGSTDQTLPILRSIKSEKIQLYKHGPIKPGEIAHLRNKQIEMTQTEWFMLVDGDEVWPDDSIQALIRLLPIVPKHVSGIVVKARLPVGDLYHYQSEIAGRYELLGRRGHYNIRAYRKDPGHQWRGIYPLEAYVDNDGRTINDRREKLSFLAGHEYWHLRLLPRSSQAPSQKLEVGQKEEIKLPEVFFQPRPAGVPEPWVQFSFPKKLIAYLVSPLLLCKRNLFTT